MNIDELIKKAQNGDAKAQYNLAIYYEYGIYVEQNDEKAVEWYIKSAEQGLVEAQYDLAICYEYGICVEQSDEKAVEWYTKAAKQGNVEAQNNLAYRYENGEGVEQSYEKAVEWFSKAAEQGDADAQCILAMSYDIGRGIEQSYEKAVEWYTKAAEQGVAEAQYRLAYCYENGRGIEQSYEKAVEWYTKAAEQGHADAQYRLAVCYYCDEGTDQNYEKAVEWFLKAAEQGYTSAQYNLAICYENGRGVEQSYEKAVEWYTKAAEQGYAKAQFILAECYYNGRGIEQSYEKAVEWCSKAAEQGDAAAQCILAICYDIGRGIEQNYKKAIEWYTKAAEQGHAKAQYNLAICYEYGIGVEQSYEKAAEWYTKAAEQGDAYAQYSLAQCYRKGVGIEQSYEKAIEWYTKAAEQGHADAGASLEELRSVLDGKADERYDIANAGKRYDVFISWNHLDKKFKDELVDGIENFKFDETGTRDEKVYSHYRAWESDRDADGLIEKCIENAIEKSKYFILILSPNSLKSKWVEKEVSLALDKVKRGLWSEENIIIIRYNNVSKELESLPCDSPFVRLREYTASFKEKPEIEATDKKLIKAICERIKNGLEAEAIKNYIAKQTVENGIFKASIKNQYDNDELDRCRSEEGAVSFVDAYLTYEKGYVSRNLEKVNNGEVATLDEIGGGKNSLYIYGDGGTGKSLYISNLIKTYFKAGSFYIRVNLIDYENRLGVEGNLTQLLNDELNRYLTDNDEYRSTSALVRAEGTNNKMTVIFDGLDEISDKARLELKRRIGEFAKSKNSYRFIFVSRRATLYDDLKEILGTLDLYTLTSFGNEEQEKLYEALNEKTKALYSEAEGKALKKAFFEMLEIIGEDISKNPFLLSNLIFIYLKSRGKNRPQNKHDLVTQTVKLFIDEMDDKKRIPFEYPQYLVGGEIKKALEYIAFHHQRGNAKSFEILLVEYFEDEGKKSLATGHDAKTVGEAIFRYLYRRNIITENKITHDIFNAYFASCYLFEKIYEKKTVLFDVAIDFNSDKGERYLENAMKRLKSEENMWQEIASELIMKLDSEIYMLDKNQKMNEDNPSYNAFDKTLTLSVKEKGFSDGAIEILKALCEKQFGFYFRDFINKYF